MTVISARVTLLPEARRTPQQYKLARLRQLQRHTQPLMARAIQQATQQARQPAEQQAQLLALRLAIRVRSILLSVIVRRMRVIIRDALRYHAAMTPRVAVLDVIGWTVRQPVRSPSIARHTLQRHSQRTLRLISQRHTQRAITPRT